MPPAGNLAADRARAHYRWAQRYARAGIPHKSITHMGRALDYDSAACAAPTAFGNPFGSTVLRDLLAGSDEAEIEITVETIRLVLGHVPYSPYSGQHYKCPLLRIEALRGSDSVLDILVLDYTNNEDALRDLDPESRTAVSTWSTGSKKTLTVLTRIREPEGSLGSASYIRRTMRWLIDNNVVSGESPVRTNADLVGSNIRALFHVVDPVLSQRSELVFARADTLARTS